MYPERFFFHRDSEGGPLGSQGDPILGEMVQNQLILKDLDGWLPLSSIEIVQNQTILKGFREIIAFIIPRNHAKSADFKEFRRGDCFSSLEIVLISKDLVDDYLYHPLKSCKTT